jgi:transcriptional regulator with XRE-family HTH domain
MNDDWRRQISDLAGLVEKRRFTQKELALHTGIDQGQISRILAGKAARFSKNVAALCAFLDRNQPPRIRDPQGLQRIEAAARELWDGTPDHAAAIVGALRAIGRLQKGGRR